MSCGNNKITELLPDFYFGRLSFKDQEKVADHLKTCDDCQKSLKTISLLSADKAVSGRDEKNDHIPEDLLSKYFEDKTSLDAKTIDIIGTHLKSCDECSYDLYFMNSLESDLSASVSAELNKSSILDTISEFMLVLVRKPAFAYFLLLLTLYPAVRWISLPVETEIVTPANYFGETTILSSSIRSASEMPVIKRLSTESFKKIEISRYYALDAFEYNIELYVYNEDTGELGEKTEIEKYLSFDHEGLIKLMLNMSDLNDGHYALEIKEIDLEQPSDFTIEFYPFSLITVTQ